MPEGGRILGFYSWLISLIRQQTPKLNHPPRDGQHDMTEDVKLNVAVPEHQRSVYDEEAEQMGFASRSAYVRAMVNAGRRDFGLDPQGADGEDTTLEDFVEQRIVAIIDDADGASRDAVIEDVAGDIEQTVTDCLARLDDAGKIDYDIQQDGLVVRSEEE